MTRLTLNIDPYTDDQVTSALQQSGRVVRYLYELLDPEFQSLGYINGVSSCSVDYTANASFGTNSVSAQINRTASISIVENVGDSIDYLSNYLRPYMGVRMPDGGWADCPLGVFVLDSSERAFADGVITRNVTGLDLTQLLMDDYISKRYVVKKGSVHTDAIQEMLNRFPQVIIADSSSTLSQDRTWDPGTPKAQIITDLVDGLGWDWYFDAWGVPNVVPFVAPADDDASWAYATDDTSLVTTSATQAYDISNTPNVFVRVITANNAVLFTSKFVNSNPTSPTSTVTRGREIINYATANHCPDQKSLDAAAKKAAVNASHVHETVTLNTVNMPFHGDSDIVSVSHDGLGISKTFKELGWSMSLALGGSMSHTLQGVVDISDVGDG